MNVNSGSAGEADEALTAAYRGLASESPPARLDAMVLREAAKPLRPAGGGFWRDAWFRPVTFVATLGLSLALILQLSDSGLLGPATDDMGPDSVVAPLNEEVMRDAAAVTAEQIRRAQPETTLTVPQAPISPPAARAVREPADVASQLPAEERCSEEQRSDSGSWWRCIEELEARGLTDAAEAELRALLAAHPGFAVPE